MVGLAPYYNAWVAMVDIQTSKCIDSPEEIGHSFVNYLRCWVTFVKSVVRLPLRGETDNESSEDAEQIN